MSAWAGMPGFLKLLCEYVCVYCVCVCARVCVYPKAISIMLTPHNANPYGNTRYSNSTNKVHTINSFNYISPGTYIFTILNYF